MEIQSCLRKLPQKPPVTVNLSELHHLKCLFRSFLVRLFRFDSYTRLADFSQFTNSVGLRILILVPDGAAAICPGRSFACLAISYDGAVIIIANGMSADSVIFAVRMNL